MKMLTGTAIIGLLVSLGGIPGAFAQQQGMQGNMQGHNMPGMDMQAMMNRCAQMRQQMKPGVRMPPNMQQMMVQCDQMDRAMNAPSRSGAQRTR